MALWEENVVNVHGIRAEKHSIQFRNLQWIEAQIPYVSPRLNIILCSEEWHSVLRGEFNLKLRVCHSQPRDDILLVCFGYVSIFGPCTKTK